MSRNELNSVGELELYAIECPDQISMAKLWKNKKGVANISYFLSFAFPGKRI